MSTASSTSSRTSNGMTTLMQSSQQQWSMTSNRFDDDDNNMDTSWTTCLIVLLLTMMIAIWNSKRPAVQKAKKERRYGMPYLLHPPQGRSVPILGQALNFLKFRPWDLMMTWHHNNNNNNKDNNKYVPIYAFPLFGQDMFSIASPLLLKHVLQSQISRVKKDIANTMKPFLVILGTGIVTSEDESWMKQRLKMSHPLRRDVLDIIPRQTLLAVQRLCREWDQAAAAAETAASSTDKNDDAEKPMVAIGASLRHLTLQVISGSFLSLSAEESDSTFAKMYLPIVDEANKRVWHPYRAYMIFMPQFWTFRHNVQLLNNYVSQLINTRWTIRRQEEEEQERLGGGCSPTNSSGRSQDILDKVLAVYEKQLHEELERQHPQQKQQGASTSIANRNGNALLRRNLSGLPMTLSRAVVRQFRDEMKTFMLAGHETSAAMMTWAFYEMLGQDDLQQAVRHEGCSVFGAAGRTDIVNLSTEDLPSSENLAHLVLSQACLMESLRKYSVVPIVARRTIEDVYLPKQDENGNDTNKEEQYYFIPKGSSFLINIQAVHHDPRYWPEPMKFDPHRFLRPQDGNAHHQQQQQQNNGHDTNGGDNNTNHEQQHQQQQHEPFTFLPFIAGPRNCLGQHLALLESKMVLAMLIQRYTFTLPKNVQVQLQDWSTTPDKDPRHRFMVPVIPKQELLVHVSRNFIQ